MLIKETKSVEREIHVAPCLECGHTDILLTDYNYSSFNSGGGQCKNCKHETFSSVGCSPSVDHLAAIWNASNDVTTLVQAEESKISGASKRIAEIMSKSAAHSLSPVPENDRDSLFSVAHFKSMEEAGFLSDDDRHGVWATATHKSPLSVRVAQPDWATHVLWLNK